jgi:hypothetical protein
VTKVGLVALVVIAGGCSEAPRPPAPGVWTLPDVRALYAQGATPDTTIATDAGIPGGMRLGGMLASDAVTLTVHPGWADGYAADYVVTEIWSFYDRVWLQPLYWPVKGWSADGKPMGLAPQGGAWVFGVGPGSGFYSPFWQVIYVEVPADTTAGALSSVRQIVDGGYPLRAGPGRTVALAPGTDVVVPLPMGDVGPTVNAGWLDGAPAPFVDFGAGLFTWDEQQVINEIPLYVFAFRAGDGTLVAPDVVPGVMAPGPPGSGLTAPPKINGTDRYTSFWRVYRVTLPSNARIFAPGAGATRSAIDSALEAAGVAIVSTYGVTTGADEFIGKIAVNPIDTNTNAPACFADANLLEADTDLSHCQWLDSQVAIESLIDPSLIERTEITVTAPVVTVRGKTVTPL